MSRSVFSVEFYGIFYCRYYKDYEECCADKDTADIECANWLPENTTYYWIPKNNDYVRDKDYDSNFGRSKSPV